jgi:hypothetical protein
MGCHGISIDSAAISSLVWENGNLNPTLVHFLLYMGCLKIQSVTVFVQTTENAAISLPDLMKNRQGGITTTF